MRNLFPITGMLTATKKTANKKIIKIINEWNINRLYNEYSLQEYIGFSDKEYANWINGKWDANKIYSRRELIGKLWWKPYYKIIHFFEFFTPSSLLRFFKYKFQKLFRGWDDSDLWELRNTFAKFIIPRLKRFRDTTISYPGYEDADTPEKWNDILNKMIWSFEEIEKGGDYPGSDEDLDNNLYPNVKKMEEYNAKIQEGLDLFAKYFQHLWD